MLPFYLCENCLPLVSLPIRECAMFFFWSCGPIIHHMFYHNYPELFQTKNCFHTFKVLPTKTEEIMFYQLTLETRSIYKNQSIHLWWSTGLHMRANALKERLEDSYIFRSIFIPSPIPIPSLSLLLRHPPVPKQGTKHLVTDALVLPCQLLVLPVTIWCDPAARATERNRPVSDPLLASVTTELAFGQASIQV